MRVPRSLRSLLILVATMFTAPASADPLVPGQLLVVTDLGALVSVDPASGALTPFAQLPNPGWCRLAFDGAGNVLVRDGATGAVLRLDAETAGVTPLAEGEFLAGSLAVSVGVVAHGTDVFATAELFTPPSTITGRIVRVDAGGDQHLVAEGTYQPTAIAIGLDGTIFVGCRSFFVDGVLYPGGGVLRVDPVTGVETVLAADGNFAADGQGVIDLLVRADGSIVAIAELALVVVDPVTGAQSLLPPPVTFDPDILVDVITGFGAAEAPGSFYLTAGHDVFDEAYPGGVVHAVSGGAATSTTGPSAFTSPVDVAVIPAPEPAAALLLAAGGALLLGLRRRGARLR
jgi:hypothetical protein